jgi:co-chaperonin GroES (HSP10)
MKVIAVGHRVVVKPYSISEHDKVFASAKKAGIELLEVDERRQQTAVDRGVVIEVGPTAFYAFHPGNHPEPFKPWCKPGDLIGYTKNAGKLIKVSDSPEQHVLVINDEDVVAVLEEAHND